MLDTKDKLILDTLFTDARTPVSTLAKQCRISQPAATKRIQNLEAKGYISKYDIILNWNAVDCLQYVYLLKSRNIDSRKKEIIGSYDLEGTYSQAVFCWFRDEKEKTMFEKTIGEPGLQIKQLHMLPLKLFSDTPAVVRRTTQKQKRLDDKDKAILSYLSTVNARHSLLKIAEHLDLSFDVVHYRMKKLKQSGLITRFVAQPGIHVIGVSPVLALIESTNDIKEHITSSTGYVVELENNLKLCFFFVKSIKNLATTLAQIKTPSTTRLEPLLITAFPVLNRYRMELL